VRNDNSIQYTGNFGPVTARVEYAFGETTSFNTGSAKAVGALYRSGPLLVGAAYTRKDFAGFDYDHWTVGGAFNLGLSRIFVGHLRQEQSRGAIGDAKTTWSWLGATYPVMPKVDVTGAFYRTKQEGAASAALPAPASIGTAAARPAFTGPGDKNVFIVAATYAFSKRTNLYVELDRQKLDGALRVAPPRDSQTGFSVGINHNF
jgi:predicted porin